MFKLTIATLALISSFLSVDGSTLIMPSFAYVGDSVTIVCDIDLGHLLGTSVVFYKDGKEIYKISREDGNGFSISTSAAPGVTLNMEKRDKPNEIELTNVVEATSGVYSCKAKIDHTKMDAATFTGTLKVVPHKRQS